MLTIVPPPAGRIASSAATRVIRSVPPTLRPVTARQPLGSIASAGTKYWPPALLTSTSSRPWRARHSRTIRSASSSRRMSPGDRARERADPLAGVGQHVLPAPGQHDVRAAGGELGRGRAAEVGAASGDEDHPAIQQAGPEDGRRYGR